MRKFRRRVGRTLNGLVEGLSVVAGWNRGKGRKRWRKRTDRITLEGHGPVQEMYPGWCTGPHGPVPTRRKW